MAWFLSHKSWTKGSTKGNAHLDSATNKMQLLLIWQNQLNCCAEVNELLLDGFEYSSWV